MTRVLVTDANRGSAISIIRSLGERGVRVTAADAKRRSPGFASRYAAERLLYPDPIKRPDAAVDALLRAARERQIDLVIPVGDELVLLLSAARERFAGVAALALPDGEALDITRDKLATVELARRLGIPTPRSELVATRVEAADHAEALGWPIVLKPQVSRRVRDDGPVDAFNVAYAADADALEREMATFEGRCAVLLQEYYEGEGHGVGALMRDGEPLLAFQHRRLREVPITGGPSSLRESVPLDPTLLDYSVRLLGELRWTGPAMVEFKVAPGGVRLMEINGRLWGSLPLAVKSGVDLPMRMVELFLSPATASAGASFTYSLGVRSRDLTLELSWIASVLAAKRRFPFLPAPSRREALAAALRLFDPRDGFDVLSVDDPLPGLYELLKVAGKVPGRLARTLGPPGRRKRFVGLPVHQELRFSDYEHMLSAVRPRRRRTRMHVELAAELEQRDDAWDALAQSNRNVFATLEWASTWWRHYGAGRPLLVARHIGSDGRPVAIVPLHRATSGPLKVVRFVGYGSADELGPICSPDDRPQAARVLRDALERAPWRWDVFFGEHLAAEQGWSALLGAKVLKRTPSPLLRFSGGWEEFLASRTSKSRKRLRWLERRLERDYGLTYRLAQRDRSQLSDDLDTLFALHRARWPDSNFGRNEDFHRDFAQRAFERGWLRLWFLELEGRPAAAWYGFRFAGVDSHYQSGRHPEFEGLSVGTVLLTHTIREALEDGIREYRFLRGGEDYKYRFASEDAGLETVGMARGSAGAIALAAVPLFSGRRLRKLEDWYSHVYGEG